MSEHEQDALDLYDKLAAEHLQRPEVGQRRMFGRDGLDVNGKFFAFLNHDQLVLKLPPATATALISAGEASTAEHLSPTMRKWVAVPIPTTSAGQQRWRQLLAEAHAYVGGNQNTSTGQPQDASEPHDL